MWKESQTTSYQYMDYLKVVKIWDDIGSTNGTYFRTSTRGIEPPSKTDCSSDKCALSLGAWLDQVLM
jgi:hypothetical protein